MKHITINYFYTFSEVIAKLAGATGSVTPYTAEAPTFSDLFLDTRELGQLVDKARLRHIWSVSGSSFIQNQFIEELFDELLARYYSHYCASSYEDNIASSDYIDFIIRFLGVLNRTYDRYDNIINALITEDGLFIEPVKSSTTFRQNDTPQNGGDFSNDNYTSLYNRTESEIDGEPTINRIDNVRNRYPDIFTEWADEFDILFIEEGNL